MSRLGVIERAEECKIFWCIGGEPGPVLHLFVFVQSHHNTCLLLTCRAPVAVAGTQHHSRRATRVTHVPPQQVRVVEEGGRDVAWALARRPAQWPSAHAV